jgi:uncharacterized OB-fold protein
MAETVAKKRLPLRRGRFVVPEDPKQQPYLIAARCRNCGKYFVPPRVVCLNCGKQMMEIVPLGNRGKVYSYTIVHQQLPGALVKVPYAIVIVSMPEGCQVTSVVTEDFDKLQVDQPVEVYFETMIKDNEGNDRIADKFRIVNNTGKK